jgi:hypothetical protein
MAGANRYKGVCEWASELRTEMMRQSRSWRCLPVIEDGNQVVRHVIDE